MVAFDAHAGSEPHVAQEELDIEVRAARILKRAGQLTPEPLLGENLRWSSFAAVVRTFLACAKEVRPGGH